ncbi:hypothetical protein IQ272_08670 [Chroococcidiopsidales cyanobacterium LEGE 13417]|uniref:hypothetical protein n=1 Tax=Chroococcidiopsis sp. CCALA 051 TaxID=869949 RepID=UPI001304FD58|nr:hypothetical protein [Chroococcidiopsis sp. CCALA 051]MBE9016210.1 hypothetical protein [Chroococcidiopsidales cyanobacterium LEGE 13417]
MTFVGAHSRAPLQIWFTQLKIALLAIASRMNLFWAFSSICQFSVNSLLHLAAKQVR